MSGLLRAVQYARRAELEGEKAGRRATAKAAAMKRERELAALRNTAEAATQRHMRARGLGSHGQSRGSVAFVVVCSQSTFPVKYTVGMHDARPYLYLSVCISLRGCVFLT